MQFHKAVPHEFFLKKFYGDLASLQTDLDDRQVYYKLAESPFVRLIEGFIKRQKDMEAYVKTVQSHIPATMKATRTHLREMHAFHKAAAEHLQRLVEQIDSQ